MLRRYHKLYNNMEHHGTIVDGLFLNQPYNTNGPESVTLQPTNGHYSGAGRDLVVAVVGTRLPGVPADGKGHEAVSDLGERGWA